MDYITRSEEKTRIRYKKREEFKVLKAMKNNDIKKTKEKSREKDIKKEDKKSQKKNEEIIADKKGIFQKSIKNNKSINYFLSDTETTLGDTLNDKKYVYRKAVTKKNFSFAINNYIMPRKEKQIKYEKKNRLNNSMSLNKFFKNTNNNNEEIRNTNDNFYRKQPSLFDNFRSSFKKQNKIRRFQSQNLNNSFNYYNKPSISRNLNDVNYNNISCFFETNEKIINIEDLLIFEEKFNEVIMSVKMKNNTPNECFELLNTYQQSSLYNNLENYFKDISSKKIIQTSIMYLIYNVIICYNFSFDYIFFNTCYKYLESILDINHKSYLLICQLILFKIPESSNKNIWVEKLKKMLKNNLKHIELNNKEYINFLMSQEFNNYKNQNLNLLLEIKYYSNIVNKYLQLFLNSINDENKLKNNFCSLFDNINLYQLSEDKLLYFFKSKIIRIINQNASVATIDTSSYETLLNEKSPQVPYLKLPLKKKFSLVLDLDETLISFKLNPKEENKGTIRFRPFLDSFLKKVKDKYELIVFTSGTQDYADPLEDAIEQEEKYFDARLYRQHTILCGKDIVKDISRIGRPLDKIIIVENMPQNYRLQKENGILIKSFYGEDIYDNALTSLGDILMKIANEFNDVRIGIAKYKNEILDKVSTNLSKRNIK